MAGPELAVGGWVGTAVIGKLVNKVDDYLGGNHLVHKDAIYMLHNLKDKLSLILAIMKEAEKHQIQNKHLMEWLQRIKDAAYEAEDVFDDFEAKRIRENLSSKGKVSSAVSSIAKGAKNLILVDNDVKELKVVGEKLQQLCKQSSTFVELLKLESARKGKSPASTDCGEMTEVFFGRDAQKKIILTLILGYEIESPECETISEGAESLVRASNKSHIGIGLGKISQNMVETIREKLSKWFVKDEGDVGGASSSEDKTQKILEEMDPTQRHYGRPFVIPIVGISGIGKTALAQTIYDKPQVKEHFSIRRWVYLSREFTIMKIVEAFIDEHDPTLEKFREYGYDPSCDCIIRQEADDFFRKGIRWDRHKRSLEERQYALYYLRLLSTGKVAGKRFLLVLDDVCSELFPQLQDLLSWLHVGAYGSVVLVTTRQNSVSKALETIDPINLGPLEWDDFIKLLQYYAFRNLDLTGKKEADLKQVCKHIGRQLCGIPQAAKVMGNTLRLHVDVEHWKHISCNPKLRNEVFSFLEIAYQHLDLNLKQCLAFSSNFPTNYIIRRERIIQMWIANNFIQLNSSDETKSEDIGEIWFNKLVNFSFFLPTPWPDLYIMNNATRELAKAFSSDEFFYSEHDHLNPCPYGCFFFNEHSNQCTHGYSVSEKNILTRVPIPPSTRHLTVRTYQPGIDVQVCNDKLRTVLFLSGYLESPVIKQKKKRNLLLRLKVPEAPSSGKKFCLDGLLESASRLRILEISVRFNINSISKLSHLRFLDLSFSGINEFPESLCTLCHLQVLDIRGCVFESLPKNMNHLINLRHLYASSDTIELISGIGKLTKLQELEEFRIFNKKGHKIRELAEMNEISGCLSIARLFNIKDEAEAQEARLAEKKHLKSLSLRSTMVTNSPKEKNILNSLRPHSDLQELDIANYLDTELPSWILTLEKIQFIYLRDCCNVTLIPLGQLPVLEILHLEGLRTHNIGEELYGSGQKIFPALKILKFVKMIKWKVWSTAKERELFPCLEELQIKQCYELTETPLASLALLNLRKLELSCCPKILNLGGIFQQRLPMLTLLNLYRINICFEGDTQSLSNLRTMSLKESSVSNMSNIVDLNLPSLKVLDIDTEGISGNCRVYLEKWFIELSGLVELTIRCGGLRDLPSNFANLVSLRTLTLASLRSESLLPKGGMPPNLKDLYIRDASQKLEEQCRKEGKYWNKIAYIPYIRVNERTLQFSDITVNADSQLVPCA